MTGPALCPLCDGTGRVAGLRCRLCARKRHLKRHLMLALFGLSDRLCAHRWSSGLGHQVGELGWRLRPGRDGGQRGEVHAAAWLLLALVAVLALAGTGVLPALWP